MQCQMKRPPNCVKGFIQITVKFTVQNITDNGSAANTRMMQKSVNQPGMTKQS